MAKNAVFLDVDPSIIESNMQITNDTPIEKELKSIFTSANTPVQLIKPWPGFCVKTYTKTKKKVFINICHTDALPSPPEISAKDLMDILDSEEQSSYRVPMSIGEGRNDTDKSGALTTVYDVAINTNFFQKINNDELFRNFLLTIVYEGLQDKYQVEIEFENYIILKNRKSMGTLQTHRIQKRDVQRVEECMKSPFIEEIAAKNAENNKMKNVSMAKIPFRIFRDTCEHNRKCFLVEFMIPNNAKMEDLNLEVGEDRVVLEWKQNGTADFFLPSLIDETQVVAEVDRNKKILSVKMPLK